jgi:hypothetical protein
MPNCISSISPILSSSTATKICETKKQVTRFCPYVTVARTVHINDYSPGENEATWSSQAELKSSQLEIRATIKQIVGLGGSHRSDRPSNDYCDRGLESRTPKGMKQKMDKRQRAQRIVFRLQDGQDEEGIFDPDTIAFAYKQLTRGSQLEAQERGTRDRVEAIVSVDQFDVASSFAKSPSIVPQCTQCSRQCTQCSRQCTQCSRPADISPPLKANKVMGRAA